VLTHSPPLKRQRFSSSHSLERRQSALLRRAQNAMCASR